MCKKHTEGVVDPESKVRGEDNRSEILMKPEPEGSSWRKRIVFINSKDCENLTSLQHALILGASVSVFRMRNCWNLSNAIVCCAEYSRIRSFLGESLALFFKKCGEKKAGYLIAATSRAAIDEGVLGPELHKNDQSPEGLNGLPCWTTIGR